MTSLTRSMVGRDPLSIEQNTVPQPLLAPQPSRFVKSGILHHRGQFQDSPPRCAPRRRYTVEISNSLVVLTQKLTLTNSIVSP